MSTSIIDPVAPSTHEDFFSHDSLKSLIGEYSAEEVEECPNCNCSTGPKLLDYWETPAVQKLRCALKQHAESRLPLNGYSSEIHELWSNIYEEIKIKFDPIYYGSISSTWTYCVGFRNSRTGVCTHRALDAASSVRAELASSYRNKKTMPVEVALFALKMYMEPYAAMYLVHTVIESKSSFSDVILGMLTIPWNGN